MKRLSQKPEQLDKYNRVIKDELDKGTIERVHQSEKVQPCHQSTTKLHIVYNASARENRPALNDCLPTGPPLAPDILDIFIRFREQPKALAADVEKAFLMIALKKEDRDVCFLWVDDMNSAKPKIVEYRFVQVVFGVTLSPFLLNATLLKDVTNYEKEDPEFVNQMLCLLYEDDLSISLEDVDKAYQLCLK